MSGWLPAAGPGPAAAFLEPSRPSEAALARVRERKFLRWIMIHSFVKDCGVSIGLRQRLHAGAAFAGPLEPPGQHHLGARASRPHPVPLVFCLRNRVAIFRSATAPDSRSDDDAMTTHCEEERRRRRRRFRPNPSGRWRFPGGEAERFLFAQTQRVSRTDPFPVKPPSEMVILFLRQDTKAHRVWRI